MTTAEAARLWADAWKDGWEALDAERIIARYSVDATLWTEPFREPYRGRDGVRTYVTRVFGEEADPRVWVSVPIVDGHRAAISWWASLQEEGEDVTLAGTSVLRFDVAGMVTDQWDAWNQRPTRGEPPSGTPIRP